MMVHYSVGFCPPRSIMNFCISFTILGAVMTMCGCYAGLPETSVQCEPVTIPMCATMFWNQTRMPNHLYHSTQINARLSIDVYKELVDQDCSKDLLFFLCALHVPICTKLYQPIAPCRHVCENARRGCEPIVIRYNHTWPEELSCDHLPRFEDGVCISPESLVKPTPSSDVKQSVASIYPSPIPSGGSQHVIDGPDCRCENALRFRKDRYMEKKYDYVVKAKLVGKAYSTSSRETMTTVSVSKFYRLSSGIEETKQMTLWSKYCKCPLMRRNRYYVLACNRDRRRADTQRLVFDSSKCMLIRWKKDWSKKIRLWNKELRLRGRSSSKETQVGSLRPRKLSGGGASLSL